MSSKVVLVVLVLFVYNLIQTLIQDGNGYIDRQELAIMLRFMGENISEAVQN